MLPKEVIPGTNSYTGVLCEKCIATFSEFVNRVLDTMKTRSGVYGLENHATYESSRTLVHQSTCYVCRRIARLASPTNNLSASLNWIHGDNSDGAVIKVVFASVSHTLESFRIVSATGQSRRLMLTSNPTNFTFWYITSNKPTCCCRQFCATITPYRSLYSYKLSHLRCSTTHQE